MSKYDTEMDMLIFFFFFFFLSVYVSKTFWYGIGQMIIFSIFQLVIVFKSKAVKWYPFLQANCLYHFSVVEQFSPLFKSGLANAKLERAVEKSKAKKCVLVNPEANIDRIFDDATTSAQDIFQEVTIPEVLGEGER